MIEIIDTKYTFHFDIEFSPSGGTYSQMVTSIIRADSLDGAKKKLSEILDKKCRIVSVKQYLNEK